MASYASVADLLDVLAPGVAAADLDSAWAAEPGGIDRRLDAVARLGLGWAGALEWAELTGSASRYALGHSGTAIAVAQAAVGRDPLSTLIPIAYSAPFVVGAGSLFAPAVGAAVAEEVALGAAAVEETTMWESVSNWFGNALGSVGDLFSAELPDAGVDLGDLASVGSTEVWPELGMGDAGFDLGDLSGLPDIGGVSDVITGDWTRLGGLVGDVLSDTPGGGNIVPRPGVSQTMGALPLIGRGAAMAGTALGAMTLAGIFGAARGGASFVINGIKGTMPQLWKYTRKYGPAAVAQALGISVGALGTMLLQNPERARHRRRGISSRDIRTTKRVVGFVNRMAHDIGCIRRPHFRKGK